MKNKEILELIESKVISFGETPNVTKLYVINEFGLKEIKQKLTLTSVVKSFYCQSKNVAEINYNDLEFEKCKKQCDWCRAI